MCPPRACPVSKVSLQSLQRNVVGCDSFANCFFVGFWMTFFSTWSLFYEAIGGFLLIDSTRSLKDESSEDVSSDSVEE